MKVELLQSSKDKMLASDNITVKLDGRECDAVIRAELVFDAEKHVPVVTLSLIPTELTVTMDGRPLLTLGKIVEHLPEGHVNYRKNDEVQILPDDIENADKE